MSRNQSSPSSRSASGVSRREFLAASSAALAAGSLGPASSEAAEPGKTAGVQQYELSQFGVFRTDKLEYAPLEEARVVFECRKAPAASYLFQVCDGAGRPYFSREVAAPGGIAEFTVTVGGAPGLHTLRAFTGRKSSFCPFRMGGFAVVARTEARVDGTDMDGFFRWLGEALEASVNWALYGDKWVAGDKCADNSTMNLAYPRFRLDSSVYFQAAEDLKGSLDLIYAHQKPDGSLYDHIYGDGHPGWAGQRMIRSMMADLETGSIINVHQVWMATGDGSWMKGLIEPMLRGWKYATSSADLWSARHGLIKRPHTADEWDVQTGDGSCFRNENSRYVVAVCDAVRLPKAADAMAAMLEAAGRAGEAAALREFAAGARKRANDLLWDGTKYRHHVHIDPVDHQGFDEAAQLAMGNTWACNDGLADHAQAVAIIEEYERRLKATGDRYPWWSLQPGYPEGFFRRYPPGVYCNGGLFPWVGGELCRACFRHGLPARGWRLFREFWEQVKSDKGACMTWYTLDGRAAANTPWATNHDSWGVGTWGRTAIEGIVGVVPLCPAFQRCRCTPQWAAGGIRKASVCVAMPASRSYFAYEYDASEGEIQLKFTGSGESVEINIPAASVPEPRAAFLDGAPVVLAKEERNGAPYLCLTANIRGVGTLKLQSR